MSARRREEERTRLALDRGRRLIEALLEALPPEVTANESAIVFAGARVDFSGTALADVIRWAADHPERARAAVLKVEARPTGALAEVYEHMVKMALEAWDATSGHVFQGTAWRGAERDGFEAAVRERLAQSAQIVGARFVAAEEQP